MGFGDIWSNTDRRSDEICWDLILIFQPPKLAGSMLVGRMVYKKIVDNVFINNYPTNKLIKQKTHTNPAITIILWLFSIAMANGSFWFI